MLPPSSRRQSTVHRTVEFNGSNLLCVNTIPIRNTTLRVVFLIGGLEEIRTPDPHNANVVRSQLRYKPISRKIILPGFLFVKEKKSLYTS